MLKNKQKDSKKNVKGINETDQKMEKDGNVKI